MTATGKAPRRTILRRLRAARWPLLFVSPFFILFAIFSVYPFLFALWLSVVNWHGPDSQVFVGLTNFRQLTSDGRFWGSLGNTVIIFFIHAPLITLLAALFAVILNAGLVRLQGLWRAVIFLPYVTSMVAAGYTFKLLLDKEFGIVNTVLGVVGLGPVPWLDDVWLARISLGMLLVWAYLGFNTLVMLAGLQTISPEIIEAAEVDGASPIQAFRRITLPLLRPQIVFTLILSAIGSFNLFTEPYILTRGGPMAATESPTMLVFAAMFGQVRYGYAAAMGLVLMVIVVAVTLIQYRITSRGDTGL